MNKPSELLPASLEAERFVLGQAVLSAERMTELRGSLHADDFSIGQHQALWRALCDRFDRGEPTDRSSVAEALHVRGKLESVGGIGYLVSLEEGMPRLSSVDGFVQTVRDKAFLRRVALAAHSLESRAMLQTDTPAELAAYAHGLLATLQPLDTRQEFCTLAEATERFGMDRILHPKRGVDTIPLPWPWLDEKSGGLAPEQLVIVGGRTSQGKTSVATQIALHSAERGFRVVLFSLEMPIQSVYRKIVSQAADVDTWRIRDQRITADERRIVQQAYGRIMDLPIHVMDTTAANVSQIAGALRRLHSQKGQLGLVIVDHLHTLGPSGNVESRTQQIAQDARTLKLLAREFKCPFLVPAQLNNVGARENAKPTLADLRQCVHGDTRVIDADSGRFTPIRELAPGTLILGIDESQKIVPTRVAEVWSTGKKAVFSVVTKNGLQIRCTEDHKFLTDSGWLPLSEVGDSYIACASVIPPHSSMQTERGELCRLLGYLAGDGSYLKHRGVGFITADERIYRDIIAIVAKYWPDVRFRRKPKSPYFAGDFTCTYSNGWGRPRGNPIREWLREVQVFGSRECVKMVPPFVFESDDEGVANYLAGLLATDGSVKHRIYKGSELWEIQIDSTSNQLAIDAQLLLLRLGIHSRIGTSRENIPGMRTIYRVSVTTCAKDLIAFASKIPTVGKKRDLLDKLLASDPNGKRDDFSMLPQSVSKRAQDLDHGRRWRQGHARISRRIAAEIANQYGDCTLKKFVDGQVAWDRIREIEYLGMCETFDISVPNTGSFLADGIVVHNCGEIQENADMVLFTWLDIADKAQCQRGELLIGKQREGATNMARKMEFWRGTQVWKETYAGADEN